MIQVNADTGAAPTSGHDDTSSGSGFKVYGSVFKTDPRYEFLNPLGKGSYGIVCAARDRESGQRIAIKKVCPMAKRSVDAKHTLREVLLLQMLGKHPNIISVHNLSTNLKDDELYIVMDLMDTDMHRVIQSSQTLSESHVKYFLHQLLRGVKYLHDNGVLHRDLKPGNLLLTKTCQLKIADFGLARKTPRSSSGVLSINGLERPRSAPATSLSSSARDRAPMTEHVVTRWYRAPELMLQPDGFYDESVDMWSVGCIFAEILGRRALFPGKNFLHQLTLIFDVIGTPPQEATARIKSSQAQRFLKSLGKKPRVPFRTVFPNASEEALDLLERLLEFDPEKRISAQEALAHPYMQPIERKYKGVDPHPSARVDFSFDTKKLTKMDLRALIIKEVDNFRRSVAHTAAIDADVAGDGGPISTTAALPNAKSSTHHTEAGDTKKPRPPSASATGASGGRVMCGSAGISMIHSTMRQRQDSSISRGSDCVPIAGSNSARPSSASTATGTSQLSAAIGSSRQRIRVSTKPPVPKQPSALPGGIGIGDSHGGVVRIVGAHETTGLLASQVEQNKHTTENQDCGTSMNDRSNSEHRVLTSQQPPRPTAPTMASTTATMNDGYSHQDSHINPCKTAAATTFVILEQRSRMLTTAPSVDSTWMAPVSSLNLTKVVTEHQPRPEISQSPTSQAPNSPASSSASSAQSGGSFDVESQHYPPKQRGGGLTERAAPKNLTTSGPTHRRVASASLVRPKPAAGVVSTQKTQSRNEPTAFVGSTTSLIRAQRSNNGKSLADSADQVVATITGRNDGSQGREGRDESNVEALETTLKTQRSSTQLNQLEPSMKKATRKLTVPKSPKFSVMSWQKKKEMRATKATNDPSVGYVLSRRI